MSVSRRVFLNIVQGCSTAALLGNTGCGNDVEPAPVVSALLDDDPASAHYGQIAVPLSEMPELGQVGSAVTLQLQSLPARNRPFMLPIGDVLLIHRAAASDQPEYVALSSLCPHAGCPLGYSARDELIECPCHGSRFYPIADPVDVTKCAGAVAHLPALSPLHAWEVTVDQASQTAYVDLTTAPACGPPTMDVPVVIGGTLTLPFDQYPMLASPGGTWTGQAKGLGDTLIVIRTDTTQAVALSAVCTHQGCLVKYAATATPHLACPCHGSAFDLSGAVTNPPAPSPLKKYAAAISGQSLVITVA